MPYTSTGPAIENICAPVPSMNPSCWNSSAGDTTLLANPLIGTIVPAPACLAILSNTPIPVSIAVIIMIIDGVASLISFSFSPMDANISFSICPIVHIPPPIRNAFIQFITTGELGLALSVIFE